MYKKFRTFVTSGRQSIYRNLIIMKTVRFEKPPLSFNPQNLFVEKQNEANYKIFADGIEIGLIFERNGYWFVNPYNLPLTDEDKVFLIEAAKSL
jgi:hypothetical protein